MSNKTFKLHNGVEIPKIGLGVYLAENGQDTENAVLWAIESGYSHIDTAMIYQNEESVGNAIIKSGIEREKLFITTKLWNEDIRNHNIKNAFLDSLKRLQLDYVDLYLIHWPADGYQNAWKELEELYKAGKIKSIGVSNFNVHHLEEIFKICTVKPMVNQIESNPYFNNGKLIDYCKQHGIVVEAWSPLGGNGARILSDETIVKLAEKYDKTPAQIIIKWQIQKGVVVLPKSVKKERIASNIDVYDFELSADDMNSIDSLNKNVRTGPDPDNFDF